MSKTFIIVIGVSTLLLSACSSSSPSNVTPTSTSVPTTSAEPGQPVLEKSVILEIPDESEAVSSPFPIEGLAPGSWFFEGQIVGEILSESGDSLAVFPLQAIGEWMTEEHVRFEGKAEFTAPEGAEAVQLIIKNDNPSGLPENEKSETFTLHLE